MIKKILLLLVFTSFTSQAQKEGNNEIKINLPFMIAGMPEISYERIIDDSATFGISMMFSLETFDKINTRFVATPYYRLYFGKEKAKGFFIEANAAIINQKNYLMFSDTETATTTNFGLGAAIGAKFLNKNGYIGELYAGMGRLFGVPETASFDKLYPRVGLNIGKRF